MGLMKTSFLWVLVHTLTSAVVNSQNAGLQGCLTSATDIKVVTSSNETYLNASQPFNLRLSPSPGFIVYPNSPDEIAHIVTCAANSGLNVSTRSGGHSYAAYGLTGNVVVDLSNLKNLTVDNGTGMAVSQTGLLLGELAEGLWNQGQRSLPHGSCPYVGTGGHALYGGFGYYSRLAGLLLDRIVSANVVLANGTAVTASNTSNPDLFWALRGAGPSFGIVTAWIFDTLPAPEITVYYQITFESSLSANEVSSAFLSWQQFAMTAPNELAMSTVLAPDGEGQMFLAFEGSYYGSLAQFNSTIEPLIASLPSSHALNATALGWLDGLVATASEGSLDTSKHEKSNTFYAKSLITTQSSTNDSITSWVNYLFGPGLSTTTTWFSEVDLYGGAIASVPGEATAFAHRDAFLVYQFYANSNNMLPPFPNDGISLIENMLTALEPQPKAAYPNYIDPMLTPDQWQSLYFSEHITRLEQIKRDVDPNNVFNFQQAISPVSTLGPTKTNGTSPDSSCAARSAPRFVGTWLMMVVVYALFGRI